MATKLSNILHIELHTHAHAKRLQSENPTIVSSLDDAIASLFFIAQGQVPNLKISQTKDFIFILEAIFGKDGVLIPKYCLNASRLWEFCSRYAFLLSQGIDKRILVQATIESIQNEYRGLSWGQDQFLNGIADHTTIVALTAHGYLMWDSSKYCMVQCPLHWRPEEIR